ncbi:hypothetical protein VTK56DRAFT_4935 [Thermocarpiscus australiensis]
MAGVGLLVHMLHPNNVCRDRMVLSRGTMSRREHHLDGALGRLLCAPPPHHPLNNPLRPQPCLGLCTIDAAATKLNAGSDEFAGLPDPFDFSRYKQIFVV